MPDRTRHPDQSFRDMMIEQTVLLKGIDGRQDDFCDRLAKVEVELIGDVGDPARGSVRRTLANQAVALEKLSEQVEAAQKREAERKAAWKKLRAVVIATAATLGLTTLWHWLLGDAPKPPH